MGQKDQIWKAVVYWLAYYYTQPVMEIQAEQQAWAWYDHNGFPISISSEEKHRKNLNEQC